MRWTPARIGSVHLANRAAYHAAATEYRNHERRPERWRKIDAIFGSVLSGCSEEEFASLRCPVCDGGLQLDVHPKLRSFFVRCAVSSLHLGKHGEMEQSPTWWHSRVSGGWYEDSGPHNEA